MPISASSKFAALYKKEMREVVPEILVVAGMSVLILILMVTIDSRFTPILIMPLISLMGLTIFLPVVSSFKMISREWTTNSIYLTLSLPVKGASVLGSKLSALLTVALIGMVITSVTGLIMGLSFASDIGEVYRQLAARITPEQRVELLKGAIMIFFIIFAIIAYIINISFFSQVTGRLVKRGAGLLTAFVFIVTLWIMGKVMATIWQGLSQVQMVDNLTPPLQLMGINLAVVLLMAVIAFVAAILVYDHRVEL
ncbi:MAG: hypothetical protein ACM3MK_01350 [Chitinophagales bacterium]